MQYLGYEASYGVPTPRGLTLPHLLVLGLLVSLGFGRLPRSLQHHARAALAVNTPLFLLFCWRDEVRNLSLLYPTLICLMAATLCRHDEHPSPTPEPSPSP